jgi:hypothetical protein
MAGVSKAAAGLRSIPEHEVPMLGQRTPLSLYGVIGFGAVVFHMVATIDAELSQTTVAEREFVDRFKQRYGVRTLAHAPAKRNQRVRSLTKNLGFPDPRSVQKLHDLLAAEGLIR